jgi:hypothetical protein
MLLIRAQVDARFISCILSFTMASYDNSAVNLGRF